MEGEHNNLNTPPEAALNVGDPTSPRPSPPGEGEIVPAAGEKAAEANPAEKTPEQLQAESAAKRRAAIEAYHDANTPAKKAAVVKQYPELAKIFSAANHS